MKRLSPKHSKAFCTDKFFEDLPSFENFNELTRESLYHPAPMDWSLVITDVRDSTKAIDSGRYRDVNTLGAACIVALQNGIDDLDFPFVFGGDGATFLIPSRLIPIASKILLALQKMARKKFDLEFLIGAISIDELVALEGRILVAKFRLPSGKSMAMFQGGGLSQAENLIKSNIDKYSLRTSQKEDPNLEGLSCRWNPIPVKREKIISLLVEARGVNKTHIYKEILDTLNSIFDGNWENANPAFLDQASYRGLWDCLRDESRYHIRVFTLSFFKRVLEIIFSMLIFRLHIRFKSFDSDQYLASVPKHSDFRKFDDMLRMVLDCSNEQLRLLRQFLDKQHLGGNIFYGIHESNYSLMTCLVGNTHDGNHLHLIDGGDGGYAMAARQLKNQKK